MQIHKTGAADYNHWIKALICGNSGQGKTRISSTFKNPIYASAEGGLMSVADRNVPYVEIESSDDLLKLRNMLDQAPKVRAKMVGQEVDTVIIDTLDEVQKILIQERLKTERKDALGLQDWGWLSEQMLGIVRGFRDLDMNTVFTCHVKEVTDGDTGQVWFKPGLQGSVADQLAYHVDLSLLLTSQLVTEMQGNQAVKVERRQLLSRPTAKYPFLKDRSGKLPAEMDVNFNDDYQRIYDLIFANVGDLQQHDVVEVSDDELLPTLPSSTAPVSTGEVKAKVAKVEDAAEEVEEPAKPIKPIKPISAGVPKESRVQKKPKAKPKEEAQQQQGFVYGDITSRNELPEGVTPVNKGYGVDLYCTMCGSECEDSDVADLSRIRYRKILDRACMSAMKSAK